MTHEGPLRNRKIEKQSPVPVISEDVLIDRAQHDDTQALAMLWMRFLPGLEAAAHGIAPRAEVAKEILQDAFIKVMHGVERFEPGHAFFPWARTIVVNTARSVMRPAHERRTIIPAHPKDIEVKTHESHTSDFYRNPEQQAITHEMRELVREVLPALSPRNREICEMYYFNEMSAQDIADHLEIEVNTVKTYLVNVRREIETTLEQRRAKRKAQYEATQFKTQRVEEEKKVEAAEPAIPIEHVIGALEDEREKDVARMRFIENLPFLTIAQDMGVSESTVMRWMPQIEAHLVEARAFLQLPKKEQDRLRAERERKEAREKELKTAAITQIGDPVRRMIMRLRYEEGLTQVQIAARVMRTERTVQRQLARGEEELNRLIARLREE